MRRGAKFNYNLVRGITDMGLELQQGYQVDSVAIDPQCIGNVFFEWNRAYGNSCGISAMWQMATGARVEDNQIDARWASGVMLEQGHMSMGIEVAGDQSTCRNNHVGGPFIAFLTVSVGVKGRKNSATGQDWPPLRVESNKFYGATGPNGGVLAGNANYVVSWPGIGGYGTFTLHGNHNLPYADMPQPRRPRREAQPDPGPTTPPATQPSTQPATQPTTQPGTPPAAELVISAAAVSDTAIVVNIPANSLAGLRVRWISTSGRERQADVIVPSGASSITLAARPMWKYDIELWDGTRRVSNTLIGVQAIAPPPAPPATQPAPPPATQPSPPPTPTSQPLDVTISAPGYDPATVTLRPRQN
jgi:hypothetical protein